MADSSDPASFQTTHWSLVLLAAERGTSDAEAAIAQLCSGYWQPVYGFLRRSGESVHAAQDLTQEFFCRLLAKNYLQAADPERGRFRSFLLAAVKHFLANERKAARTQKRGGGQQVLSLDFQLAEATYQNEPADERTPEQLFEQQWAVLLLERVLQRLEHENLSAGKEAAWPLYRSALIPASDTLSYADIAAQLGTTEAVVKMTVHRLRKRYRELLRDEIAQTVAEPAEIEQEMRDLLLLLSAR
jgi:RNA polymerase sigma-70 factor (ECF subfamily)